MKSSQVVIINDVHDLGKSRECTSMPTPTLSVPRADLGVRRYRSIFISDLHLGSKGCKAENLLDFLDKVESDYLYLVGDIVDGWRLKKRWFWPAEHGEVLRSLVERARRGTEVIYLPGNHDEALRKLIGQSLAGVRVVHDTIHETVDGKRMLVVHGDVFDSVVRDMKWLALIGSAAYETALAVNNMFNAVRRWLGYRYWSISGYLKDRVKAAVKFVDDYERRLAAEARLRQVTGVICGHVHKPEMRHIDGVLYVNDGDWVENCSALVEHHDGRLELLDWPRGTSLADLPAQIPVIAPLTKPAALAA
jgi:UDP-2,3-diacylglucosamine pyrophosphatase LpxH